MMSKTAISIWQQRRQQDQSERPHDHRTPWQRDKARILHSAAFRRLQAKTQIMGVGQNDFYRTRLTHSLEAAQIGTALVAQLQRNAATAELAQLLPADSLMEALCLAHDIGHPPFGHGGEYALHHCMRSSGGFEGNGQTLRIVGKLEPYTAEGGMNLSRRTLLGLLKYPVLQPHVPAAATMSSSRNDSKPCKAIYREDADLLDWILEPLSHNDREQFQAADQLPNAPFLKARYKSLDASIMELADDIAYGVHDLEDAVVTGTVQRELWLDELAKSTSDWEPSTVQFLATVGEKLFRSEHYIRKDAIGALVNRLITSVDWQQSLPQTSELLIRYNAVLPSEELKILQLLKSFVYRHVILHPSLQQLEFRGQTIVRSLFQAFSGEPERLLPFNTQQRWRNLAAEGLADRAICDYIAGMTDEYAERMYQRLFGRS
jgi:dGTPase